MGSSDNLRDFFTDALHVGAVRGSDATGVFQVHFPRQKFNRDPDIYIEKAAVMGIGLLGKSESAAAIVADAGKCFLTVGHHRAATRGDKAADSNAHPFIHYRNDGSRIVGVHNGTLSTWNTKETDGDIETRFDVDSDWLIYQLSVKPTAEVLGKLSGAAALVWYDSKDTRQLNMWTNGARPLHFAILKEPGDRVIFASEPEMLYWLAKRNNLSIKDDTVYSCKPRRWYKFNASRYGEFEKYTHEDTPYVAPPATNNAVTNFTMRERWNQRTRSWEYDNAHDWQSGYGVGGWSGGSYAQSRNRLKSVIATAQAAAVLNEQITPPALPAPRDPADVIADLIDSAEEELRSVEQAGSSKVTTRPPAVSARETRTLEDLDLKVGTEGVFEYTEFEPYVDGSTTSSGTLYGNVLVAGKKSGDKADLFEACIRHADPGLVKELKKRDGFVKLLGAYLEERGEDERGVDVIIVCSHPTGYVGAQSTGSSKVH